MRRFLIVAIIIFSFIPQGVFADETSCLEDGYTIVTMNGIFTNEQGAQKNKESLKRLFRDEYKGENLNVDYLLNPSHLAGLGDLIKSIEQKLLGSWAVADYDLIEMIKDASERVKTQKLLLVAHSQGNFYANGFYDFVAGKKGGVPTESIGVYGVASPASKVAGGGKWLTSDTDKVIAKWVSALTLGTIAKPNTSIKYKESDDKFGHDFSNVYLRYEGDRMVSEIKKSLDKLSENNIQKIGGPCIEKPDLGLIGNARQSAKGAILFVLDPTARVVRASAEGAYGTAAKVAHKSGAIVYDITDLTVSGIKSGVTLTVSGTKFTAGKIAGFFKNVFAKNNGTNGNKLTADIVNSLSLLDEQEQDATSKESPEQPSDNIDYLELDPATAADFAELYEREKKKMEIQKQLDALKSELNEILVREANGEITINTDGTITEVADSSSDAILDIGYPDIVASTDNNGNSDNGYSSSGGIGSSQADSTHSTSSGQVGSPQADYSEDEEEDEEQNENTNDQNEEQTEESEENNENNAVPIATALYLASVPVNEEIVLSVLISNLDSSAYDIKASIESDRILSDTYNGGEWKSSIFYILESVSGSAVSGKELRLAIQDDEQLFRGSASLIIKVRKSGTSSVNTVYSGTINIIDPVQGDLAENLDDGDGEEDANNIVKLLISEVQINGGDGKANNDFIKIYNPTDSSVDLSGWKIRKRLQSGNESSVRVIPSESLIQSGGYFTWANSDDGFSASIDADIFSTSTLTPNSSIAIIDPSDVQIDALAWGSGHTNPYVEGQSYPTNPDINQVLKRKVLSGDECISPQEADESMTDLCDTDNNANDFILIDVADPVEVVEAEIDGFKLSYYDEEKLEIVFPSEEFSKLLTSEVNNLEAGVIYKIKDNDTGEYIFETDSTTEFRYRIYEVGRNYNFSIEAFNLEGVEIASVTDSISVPTFINNTHFYSADYRYLGIDGSGPLIEFSYDDYPFLPPDLVINGGGDGTANNYKVVVFYLNKEAPKHEFLSGSGPLNEDMLDALRIEYESCAGSRGYGASLLLVDNASNCNTNGGFNNSSMRWPFYLADNPTDNHLLFPAKGPDGETSFSQDDYFTVAFYGFYRNYPQGSPESFAWDNFKLLAVDKTHYTFNEGVVEHQKPNPPADMQFSLNEDKAVLTVSWPGATDPDSIDAYLRYEISYDNGETWKEVGLSDDSIVEPGANYSIQVRAIDDFGLESDLLLGSFEAPQMPYPKFSISNFHWGNIDGNISLSIDYDGYPFIPDDSSSYNAMVFYFNQMPPLTYAFNVTEDSSYPQVGVAYLSCSGTLPESRQKLILARYDLPACATWVGGVVGSALYPSPNPSSDNITLPIERLYNSDKSLDELSADDYITIGFYKIDGIGVWNPGNVTMIANDTHRYYFTPQLESSDEGEEVVEEIVEVPEVPVVLEGEEGGIVEE